MWLNLWNGFYKRLSQDEYDVWDRELKRHNNTSDYDIEAAIREISKKKIRYPNLKTLFVEIYQAKKPDEPDWVECDKCGDGWVVYKEHGKNEGRETAVPCLCSRGQHWLDKYYSEELHDGLMDRARIAIREAGAYEAEMKEKYGNFSIADMKAEFNRMFLELTTKTPVAAGVMESDLP